jgi:ribose-phosphate pyrophosphokinase
MGGIVGPCAAQWRRPSLAEE